VSEIETNFPKAVVECKSNVASPIDIEARSSDWNKHRVRSSKKVSIEQCPDSYCLHQWSSLSIWSNYFAAAFLSLSRDPFPMFLIFADQIR
jgi:hypothetical protein